MIAALEEAHGCEVREALAGACRLCKEVPTDDPLADCRFCAKLCCSGCVYYDMKVGGYLRCTECQASDRRGP